MQPRLRRACTFVHSSQSVSCSHMKRKFLNPIIQFNLLAKAKKKIVVFTVCRPTLFYSCRPYHFFPKIKKRDCFPVLLERSRMLVPVFKFFADSIRYVVKPFTDTFGFCQSKMVTFSSLFISKNVITKIRKACLKQQVIDDLRYLMTTIHAMTFFFFRFISLFCCLMLYM